MEKKTNLHEQIIQEKFFQVGKKETAIKNVNAVLYDRSAKLRSEKMLILNYGAVLYNLCS